MSTLDTFSAHRFCTALQDSQGRWFLTDRIPFAYTTGYADDRLHPVTQGDTLRALAARYFAPLSYAAELWYILADYQPADYGGPIFDPTIMLDPSTRTHLVIPSVATVLGVALSEQRRLLHDV
jgi:hypothetical protein